MAGWTYRGRAGSARRSRSGARASMAGEQLPSRSWSPGRSSRYGGNGGREEGRWSTRITASRLRARARTAGVRCHDLATADVTAARRSSVLWDKERSYACWYLRLVTLRDLLPCGAYRRRDGRWAREQSNAPAFSAPFGIFAVIMEYLPGSWFRISSFPAPIWLDVGVRDWDSFLHCQQVLGGVSGCTS